MSLTYANADADIWRGRRWCLLANAVLRVAIGSVVAGGEVVDRQTRTQWKSRRRSNQELGE
jgi:hypothetical protein